MIFTGGLGPGSGGRRKREGDREDRIQMRDEPFLSSLHLPSSHRSFEKALKGLRLSWALRW